MQPSGAGWKTFILAIVALVATWIGVYLNMFDPGVFIDCLYATMGAYGLRTFSKKFAAAIAAKK